MKKMLRLLLQTTSMLLCMTAVAHADPVSALVTALTVTLQAGGIGAFFLKAAAFVALKVGSSLLQKALSKNQKAAVAGINGTVKLGGDNPLSIIVGTYATAGTLEYVGTWGKDGKTPNAYLTQVISLSDFPVDGLSNVLWVNGEKCEIDFATGIRPDGSGYNVKEFAVDGRDYLIVNFFDGHGNVLNNFLFDKFSGNERPWTADMIGNGIAYATVTARVNRELMTGVPQCRFVVRGARLYDPRKDSSNGGSGVHRWNNQATWEWTENPVVIIYNILRGLYYNGEWLYGVQDMVASQLPVGNWFAAMNECDRLITNADGSTEKQFRVGAELDLSQQPLDAVEELRKSCNARIMESGGIYKILVGAAAMPVFAFNQDRVAITQPQTFTPFPGLESLFNGVHSTYPEMNENWANKDAPPIYRTDLEEDDDGRRLMASVDFPYVPFSRQVQRLAKAMIDTERRFRVHKLTLGPETSIYEPLDSFSYTNPAEGYIDKQFLIEQMDDLDNGNQAVAMREVDPTDYDWNAGTDERPTTIGSLVPMRPGPQVIQDFQVFPYTVVDGANKARRPGVLLVWNGEDQDDVIGVQYRIRKAGFLEFDYMGQTFDVEKGDHAISEFVLANQNYIVNARWIGASPNREFPWSVDLPVTAPDVKLSSNDIIVELQAVQEDMREVLEETAADLVDIRKRIEQVANDAATGTGKNIVDRTIYTKKFQNSEAMIVNESRIRADETGALAEQTTLLTSKIEDPVTGLDALSSAFFQLSSEVNDPDSGLEAIASALLDVEASVGDLSAGGLISFRVQVPAPAGTLAQINIMARASTAESFIQSGMVIQIYNSGGLKSRILMLTDNFVVWDGTTQNLPFQYSGGVLRLAIAHIGLVTAGMIRSANSKLQIDLDNVFILMQD